MSVVILPADSVGSVPAILLLLQFVICAFVLGHCKSGCEYLCGHLLRQTHLLNDESCVSCDVKLHQFTLFLTQSADVLLNTLLTRSFTDSLWEA